MEPRETVHSPPFWASTSNASNPSPTSPYSNSSSTQSGIKPWIIVLLISIVVLLFLPTVLSSSFRNTRSGLSIKSGWDVLNLCLVVFAILCGVLSRMGDGSGTNAGSAKQPRAAWTRSPNPMVEVNRTAGIRRMRSSSSYPDLRVETDMWGQNRVPDSWQFFDDVELYRTQRSAQLHRIPDSGEQERECRTTQVDTERFPQEEEVEKETNFEEGKVENETILEEENKGIEAMVVRRRRRRSLEALPKMEEVEKEPMVVVGRRRRRSLERFPSIGEVEKENNFEEVEEEKIEKRQMVVRRRRKSLENFPKMDEIEKETKVEEEMVEKPPEEAVRSKKSSENLPEIEEVPQGTNCGENMVEKPPMAVEVVPPPPPPPPPTPPQTKAVEECRKHRRSGSGGGPKDFASAIVLLYQKKKKGNKSNRKEKQETSIEANSGFNSTSESNINPSTAPPPPPPPPPPSASIFYQLFSNKRGGSKSQRIHSLSASTYSNSSSTVNIITTPPPPPPLPPQEGPHWSMKHEISSSGNRIIENSENYVYRRRERSRLSPYANYPLPPRSPLPPSPPPPPPVCENVTENREDEEKKNGSVAVFCASPDVNDKADLFIKRFRDGLKLEKINSIKEKKKRKGRLAQEGKFGGEDEREHI